MTTLANIVEWLIEHDVVALYLLVIGILVYAVWGLTMGKKPGSLRRKLTGPFTIQRRTREEEGNRASGAQGTE